MQEIIAIRKALLKWYRRNHRDLPWRKTSDPYAIWLSEIMLQQTRVETVIEYYERFLKRFPTVYDLARAKEDDVLKLWEGLGYYSRALNLHETAKIIVDRRNGVFPQTVDDLLPLPGIGRYTAGAIASIAFGKRAPVLDGNVKRILSRVYAIESRIDRSETVNRMWRIMEDLVPVRSPGDFNQSMMELGARICLPKKPLCDNCPLKRWCNAFAQDCPEMYPSRKVAKVLPHYEVVAAAIYKRGRYLLGKRPPRGMLSGLWEFPGGKVESRETHSEALKREILEEIGIEIEVGDYLLSVNHGYSHCEVTIHLYKCTHIGGQPKTLYHSDIKWVPKSKFALYSFPAANLRFFDCL